MNINPTKYTLTVNIHDDIQGATCTILDMEVGRRGWFMSWWEYDGWHRIHTSTVESIMTDESDGEAVQIIVTTRNTVYIFKKIEENT